MRPHGAQDLSEAVKKSPHTLLYEHFEGEVPSLVRSSYCVMRLFEMYNATSVIGITEGERTEG